MIGWSIESGKQSVQAARQLRFTDTREISKLAKTIKAYICEAIGSGKGRIESETEKEFRIWKW